MTAPARLPLARLLLVGMLVPAAMSGLDHWLLTRMQLRLTESHVALTMAAFVVQVGLLGWLSGTLLDNPWWRWGVYAWGWVLVDLQLLSATVFADGGRWWSHGRLLPGSLFAAQVGLAIIWAVLGTTRWTIRLPACAVLAIILSVPTMSALRYSAEMIIPVQMIALAVLCLVLRWRRFRLQVVAPEAGRPIGAGSSQQLPQGQFTIRHVLIWTTSLAILLGVLRALDLLSLRALSPFFENGAIALTAAGIVIAGVFIVALFAAVGTGPAWLRLSLLAAALCLAGPLLVLFRFLADNPLSNVRLLWTYNYTRTVVWQQDGWLITWTGLAGSLLFATLLILRVRGYRLVQAARSSRPASQPA
jgi:hypothetical protein